MEAALSRRRFTVDEFHRMAEAGILDGDDRVELLDGQIVEMAAIGSRHAACVARLTRLFSRLLGDEAIVWVQNPVRFDPHTELVPDVTLLQPRDDFYSEVHPRPADVLLIVEVAETTAANDRQIKIPVYGGATIPEVWLIDIQERRVEVYLEPRGDAGYGDRAEVPEGGVIESDVLAECVAAEDVLP